MTKPLAPVTKLSMECLSPRLASRGLLAGAVLALVACTSTPLPPWSQQGTPQPVTSPDSPADNRPVAPPSDSANTTPVASSAVQPLPYSSEVAALFPEPQERSAFGAYTDRGHFVTNAELAELLMQYAKTSSLETTGYRLELLRNGTSQRGVPIDAVVITKAEATSPVALDKSGRATVMIVAGQRGDAPASTEAVLALLQGLDKNPLLDKLNLVLVPRANPDGFETHTTGTADGTDLAHDHLLLQTPEAQFLAKLVSLYRPTVILDAGEFAAIEPTLQRFGLVRANDLGLQYAVTPNAHEFVTKAAREWFHQPLASSLSQLGLRVDWNYAPVGSSVEQGFAMDTTEPISLANAAALKNIVGLNIQSRGSDIGHTHAERRIYSHLQAMNAVLKSTATRATDLRKIATFVTRDIASQACRGQVTVQAQPRTEQRDVMMVEPQSAQLVQKTVAWTSSLELVMPRVRKRPCGYWLAADAAEVAKRLDNLGVQVQRVAELAPLSVENYTRVSTEQSGPVSVTLTRATMEAPPGSYYVSMNQPLANLAAAVLEPDTPYSYHRHGLLHNLTDTARVMELATLVFEDE